MLNNGQMGNESINGLFNGKRGDAYSGIKGQKDVAEEQGFKCPVYKCNKRWSNDMELEQHYNEEHNDLKELGLSLVRDQDTGQMVSSIKDTLLTSMIALAVTNKEQFRLFQSDFQEDEANALRAEISKILNKSEQGNDC